MTRGLAVIAVFGLAASALPVAAGEEGKTLPAWVEKPLEAANPYVGAASDVYGGASGAVEATTVMRNSGVAREVGNKALRHAKAMEYNLARKTASGYVDAAERFHLGTATTVADVGSTLTAQALEGDWRSMPGTIANAGVKNAATSGGAWAGGAAGAALGSFFSPVGTLVGGAIGAGLGAMGVGMGYDAASEGLKANGYKDVQGYVDSLVAEDPRAAFAQAQQNRREWLVERGLEPIVGGDPDFVKPATAASIIPDDCTLDVELWNKSLPSLKWRGAFRVSGDSVTGRGEYYAPPEEDANHRRTAMRTVDEFTGTRRDDVFTGTSHGTMARARQESWSTSATGGRTSVCAMEWWTKNTVQAEWTFLPGGKAVLRASGSVTTTTEFSGECGSSRGRQTDTSSFGEDAQKDVVVVWKLR